MPGAIFLGMDLANFYLNMPMPIPEYMRLRLDVIPNKIIVAYNLWDLVTADGWVYIAIHKGMYSLSQAGILANQLLECRLATKRILPVPTHARPLAPCVADHHVLSRC